MENEINILNLVEKLEQFQQAKNLTKKQKEQLTEIQKYLTLFECPACKCILGYSSNKEEWNKNYMDKWKSILSQELDKHKEEMSSVKFSEEVKEGSEELIVLFESMTQNLQNDPEKIKQSKELEKDEESQETEESSVSFAFGLEAVPLDILFKNADKELKERMKENEKY